MILSSYLLSGGAPFVFPTANGNEMWFNNPTIHDLFLPSIGETLLMTFFGTLFTVIFGLPLGLLLHHTSSNGLSPNKPVNRVLGIVANVVRSIPFIIGIVVLIPLTRILVGTSIGWAATVVPLVILSVPFFARLVESDIQSVENGKIEAAYMMGASPRQIRWGVQIREALPTLINSITVLAITVVGNSAMAGAVAGGGLGQLALQYGYNRKQMDTGFLALISIVIIVQIVQTIGDMLSRLVDHR